MMNNITINGQPITDDLIDFFVDWPVSPISEIEDHEDDDFEFEEDTDEITQNFQRCRSFVEG
jgi:hypothetical protein